MSLESEIASLTTATTSLLSAVNVSKASLDGKVEAATTQADLATAQVALATTQANLATTNGQAQVALATTQADLATAQVALATTQANLATTNGQAQVSIATTKAAEASASASSTAGVVTAAQLAATQANAAKDLAIQAWSASTAPAETIAALSQVMHLGTVVDVCIDRPSTHSDGGAWIDRCQDKSWYTETLGGDRWLSAQATIAAAWTAAGSATGAVFQASATAGPLTLGKFYAATSATTATEVFRGIRREYPRAGVAWIAESARVVGYDCGTGAMFIVITTGGFCLLPTGTLSCVDATNGYLVVGQNNYDVQVINFAKDSGYRYGTSGVTGNYKGNISQRHLMLGWDSSGTALIVSRAVLDVAITTLENSTIDPATGMPVPTIAVATDGNGTYSVTVIKDNGTVANIASDSTGTAVSVDFDGKALKVIRSDGTVYIWNDITGIATGTAPNQTLTAATIPALLGTVSKQATRAKGSSTGLTRIQRNPTTLASSMVATAAHNFSTGWQIGDSRLATICAADGVTESVVGSGELVTNGTFTTDTDWTKETGWTISSGVATCATLGANISQAVLLVIGKRYAITLTVGGGDPTGYLGNVPFYPQTGTSTLYIVASASTDLIFTGTATTTLDNISVKLAEPDRSVKNNGLVINGTLTKTPVAVGAALCAYSGFSAANYLEQPYNSQLDFGTGDFCVMGWVNFGASAYGVLLHRSQSASSGGILIQFSNLGAIDVYLSASTSYVSALTVPSFYTANSRAFVAVLRSNGVLYVAKDGLIVGQVANTTNLTYTGAITRVGCGNDVALVPFNGSISLLRASATSVSSDQSQQIYRDELPLFQPGAQCTLAGTSPAVTALAYDDTTDILHVGTSYGRSSFKNLLRVESEATTVGTPTAIAASGGTVIMAGTSAKLYTPAKYLRDELQRREESRKALGRLAVFFPFTATAGQTVFTLPAGYTPKALYQNGSLGWEGTTGVYWSRSDDGYKESCTLSVGATVSDRIVIMATRKY